MCERTDMAFSMETFSLTVTLIDRFLASYKVKSKYLECLAVSCLYIAAKVREEDDKISITSEFLYDCNSKVCIFCGSNRSSKDLVLFVSTIN